MNILVLYLHYNKRSRCSYLERSVHMHLVSRSLGRTCSSARSALPITNLRSAAFTRPLRHSTAPRAPLLLRAPSGVAGLSSPLYMGNSVNKLVTRATMAAMPEVPAGQELAVLGGGCFWCLEACYQQLKGVSSVVSGYAGGHVENPTYEQVCGKQTGHAEVVGVVFDPSVISLEDLLDVFFTIHDPTTPNRQGNDVGPQYRSIILYGSEQQKATAEKVMKQVAEEGWYDAPLVTELVPLTKWYTAERHHQNYYNDNPRQGYCQFVVAPKVAKFRSKYLSKLIKA